MHFNVRDVANVRVRRMGVRCGKIGISAGESSAFPGELGILRSAHSPAEGTRASPISSVHLFLVIDGLISSLCERKQIWSNLQQ